MRGHVRLEVDRGQIYGGGVCRDDRRCERARRLRTLRSQDLQPGTAGAPALFWAAEDPAELWERHDGPVVCAALGVAQRAVAADERVYGQVAGVVAAHDRALRVLPKGHQMTGQLAMMLVMVGYTFLGLYLLFGG